MKIREDVPNQAASDGLEGHRHAGANICSRRFATNGGWRGVAFPHGCALQQNTTQIGKRYVSTLPKKEHKYQFVTPRCV